MIFFLKNRKDSVNFKLGNWGTLGVLIFYLKRNVFRTDSCGPPCAMTGLFAHDRSALTGLSMTQSTPDGLLTGPVLLVSPSYRLQKP